MAGLQELRVCHTHVARSPGSDHRYIQQSPRYNLDRACSPYAQIRKTEERSTKLGQNALPRHRSATWIQNLILKPHWEEASEMIINGLSVLGPEYTEIMENGLKNRWIDRADNVGKRTGSFCSSVYGVHPYISTRWHNNLRAKFSLSHTKLGHAAQGGFISEVSKIWKYQTNDVFSSKHLLP